MDVLMHCAQRYICSKIKRGEQVFVCLMCRWFVFFSLLLYVVIWKHSMSIKRVKNMSNCFNTISPWAYTLALVLLNFVSFFRCHFHSFDSNLKHRNVECWQQQQKIKYQNKQWLRLNVRSFLWSFPKLCGIQCGKNRKSGENHGIIDTHTLLPMIDISVNIYFFRDLLSSRKKIFFFRFDSDEISFKYCEAIEDTASCFQFHSFANTIRK